MKKIALIRGKFLTKYDMEPFEALSKKFDFTAFGSKTSRFENFVFPTVKLWSPVDLPSFPYKMQILNRLFIDAHVLYGLEDRLNGYDIAHSAETYFYYTQEALNAKRKGYVKKVVVSVLENIPFNNEGIRGRKKIKERTIDEADKFITLSSYATKALLDEGADRNKIAQIGFGINTDTFYPGSEKNKDILKILFVGRIEEYKGIFEVLEVFKQVIAKFPNLELTLIGEGSKEKELHQRINALGLNSKIKHRAVGYYAIADEYRKADIFFAPSKKDKYWIEQFGMVFLEAMASGLPIITTKSGAIPEVVGDTALLSKEGDINSMKINLEKLINGSNLRKELSSRARERAINSFDIKVIAKKIERVYEEL